MQDDHFNTVAQDSQALVVAETSQGIEMRATPMRLSRDQVVFEVYTTPFPLRASEVLTNFKIIFGEQPVYSGRATVSSIISTGSIVLCEAELDSGWMDVDLLALTKSKGSLAQQYKRFMNHWQDNYKLLPEFKLWIADLQTFLIELRLWAEQIELGIRSSPSADRLQLERQLIDELAPSVIESLNALFEKFETIAGRIPETLHPPHQTYLKRHLHPLMLCAPFAHRAVQKPLGYAGDYEMVDMMLRDPQEGASVFAKLVNCWCLAQPPCKAHRNRIRMLTDKITDEALRVRSLGRPAAIFNLGCGPAKEIQNFIVESSLSDRARVVLVDFNDETLQYAGSALSACKKSANRQTEIQLVRKSVIQILKAAGRSAGNGPDSYDLIYCAGLFDYLPDRICKELVAALYQMLAPAGLLLGTNVDSSNPMRYTGSYLLEWYLNHRTGEQMRAIVPELANPADVSVKSEPTGVNIFMEIRKGRP